MTSEHYEGLDEAIIECLVLHEQKYAQYGREGVQMFGPTYLIQRLSIKAGKLKRYLFRQCELDAKEELQDIVITALLALAEMKKQPILQLVPEEKKDVQTSVRQ
jgi:hypothetical protein